MDILPGFHQEAVASGIGDCNTVSSGPDNGANNNLTCAFSNCMRHSTTEIAVNNWLGCLPAAVIAAAPDKAPSVPSGVSGNLNIAGHGNDGLLETGCGQTGAMTTDNYLSLWNQAWWAPHMKKLQPRSFPVLSIWSCHTGAGQDGADFLFELAKLVGRAVRARTGFMYSDSSCRVWFEDGSVWQLATPTYHPPPIAPPSAHLSSLYTMMPMSSTIALGPKDIEVTAITGIALRLRSPVFGLSTPESLDAGTRKAVAEELAGLQPFTAPGVAAAFVTAVITIEHAGERGASGAAVSLSTELSVLNHRLVVSADGLRAAYAGPILRSLLASLR